MSNRVTMLCLIAVLSACQPPADQSARAAAEVRSADSAWAQTFARKDIEGYLAFVESTASMQQPNGPTLTGTAAIRTLVSGFMALPNLSGTWQPATVVASRSGELAYSTGTYEFTFTDPAGRPAGERGKYLALWRRQSDGSWRMAVESFNSDLPLPGSTN